MNQFVPFDRSKHVYNSEAFEEIIKDTIRFFNGTPIQPLPPSERFLGTGVYALYYTGKFKLYKPLYNLNRTEYSMPIYVGKAVPRGWRQGRNISSGVSSYELYNRLIDHIHSIENSENLNIEDFCCRFMILENAAAGMIGTVEAALIRHYMPIWNCCIDGFGNHDPGSGRYNQARSDWDILHPGREWADRCIGACASLFEVKSKVSKYFTKG